MPVIPVGVNGRSASRARGRLSFDGTRGCVTSKEGSCHDAAWHKRSGPKHPSVRSDHDHAALALFSSISSLSSLTSTITRARDPGPKGATPPKSEIANHNEGSIE